MSKTWYGHHIETIKGEDYVLHKDYTELQNKLDNEIERLNNIKNECADEILKELQENHHLSYGVALAIRQKLINYRELKESGNNE